MVALDKREIEPIIFISVTLCYRLYSQEVSLGATMGTVSTQAFCSLEIVDGFKSESLVENSQGVGI